MKHVTVVLIAALLLAAVPFVTAEETMNMSSGATMDLRYGPVVAIGDGCYITQGIPGWLDATTPDPAYIPEKEDISIGGFLNFLTSVIGG